MGKILKYFIYTLFIPFWWLQLLLPRNKNLWVFGAWFGEKYSDNAKVLFEYVKTNRPEIKVLWLTRDKKTQEKIENCISINSLAGIYYSLRAGKVIYSSGKSDINRFFIKGAKVIQTWHGAPMKKIGLDDKLVYNSKRNFIFKIFYPFIYGYNQDAVVSTAEIFNDKLCSAFDVKPSQILLTGYPRNDVFFNGNKHQLIKLWDKQFGNPRKIIYLPTFRGHKKEFSPFEEFNFIEEDWERYLECTNSILISKGHFVGKSVCNTKMNSERVIHLSDSMIDDLNPLLKDLDLLITDYSGAYFDFLLTGKPIILAPFDFEEYLSESRELYFDYYREIVGAKCDDWSEILSTLKNGNLHMSDNQSVRQFNSFIDGDSSKRLVEEILKL
ncbi:CDP-glycerol glycerophosphotransferase family protein [Ancylomarina sp. YFZ004]